MFGFGFNRDRIADLKAREQRHLALIAGLKGQTGDLRARLTAQKAVNRLQAEESRGYRERITVLEARTVRLRGAWKSARRRAAKAGEPSC